MKYCKMTITTAVDGVENSITRKGEMSLLPAEIRLRYQEENAIISINVQGDHAQIQRRGDYDLFLDLQTNSVSQGKIGIGASLGEVEIFTHKILYSISKDSLLLSLRYDLIISGEKQEMKLRLLSRYEGEKV